MIDRTKPAAEMAMDALRLARHELTVLHGCFATDRPDRLGDSECYWQVDTSEATQKIDTALSALGGNDIHPS